MSKLKGFTFVRGESLFSGIERFKGLREKPDSLKASLPDFRLEKVLANFDSSLYTTIKVTIPDDDLEKIIQTLVAMSKKFTSAISSKIKEENRMNKRLRYNPTT
eukprot:GHVR01048972.1.p1 GENE.GHVR01048972.1~~GHVR01048972.1.p1  ORF type:complete len:104 (+),score=11.68 GHVR01048972.1:856-1167(+)